MDKIDELTELTRRFYEAVARGDTAFLQRLVSRRKEAVFIGSDREDWWEGSDVFIKAMKAEADLMMAGGVKILPGQLQAHREGNLAWVTDRNPVFRFPNGTEYPFRHTLLFHLEDGEWKLLHQHSSLARGDGPPITPHGTKP